MDVAEAQAEDVDRAVRAAKKVSRHLAASSRSWAHYRLAAAVMLLQCLPYFPFNLGYPPQAYDDGPWPRMTAEKRSRVMFRLTDLVEVRHRWRRGWHQAWWQPASPVPWLPARGAELTVCAHKRCRSMGMSWRCSSRWTTARPTPRQGLRWFAAAVP